MELRTIPWVMLAVVGLLGGCDKTPDPNKLITVKELLINPSVESGSGTPDGWVDVKTNPAGTYYVSQWTTEQAATGKYSLKISSTGTNGPNYLYWTQNLPFDLTTMVGKRLAFSTKIKLDNVVPGANGEGVGLIISFYDNNGILIDTSSTALEIGYTIIGTSNWTNYSLSFRKPIIEDTHHISIQLILGPDTTGTVYFDDMSLRPL